MELEYCPWCRKYAFASSTLDAGFCPERRNEKRPAVIHTHNTCTKSISPFINKWSHHLRCEQSKTGGRHTCTLSTQRIYPNINNALIMKNCHCTLCITYRWYTQKGCILLSTHGNITNYIPNQSHSNYMTNPDRVRHGRSLGRATPRFSSTLFFGTVILKIHVTPLTIYHAENKTSHST